MTPSNEVNEAVGTAPDVDAEIAALETELAVPTEREAQARRLAELKRQKAEQAQAAFQAEAEKRLLGIKRAYSSLVEQSTLDDRRLVEAARAFNDRAQVLDERFRKVTLLRHEAAAVAEAFGLPMPELPSIVVPASRPELKEAFTIVHSAPVRESGYIQSSYEQKQMRDGRYGQGARTFEELADTPSFALLRRKIGK